MRECFYCEEEGLGGVNGIDRLDSTCGFTHMLQVRYSLTRMWIEFKLSSEQVLELCVFSPSGSQVSQQYLCTRHVQTCMSLKERTCTSHLTQERPGGHVFNFLFFMIWWSIPACYTAHPVAHSSAHTSTLTLTQGTLTHNHQCTSPTCAMHIHRVLER